MNPVIQVHELQREALGRILKELAEEAFRARFEVAPNPCVGAAVMAGVVTQPLPVAAVSPRICGGSDVRN